LLSKNKIENVKNVMVVGIDAYHYFQHKQYSNIIEYETTIAHFNEERECFTDTAEKLQYPVLCQSAQVGNISLIEFLYNEGIPLTVTTKDGYLPIHCAVISRRIAALRIVLNLGSPLNLITKGVRYIYNLHVAIPGGATALDIAIRLHHVVTVKSLLNYGGQTNLPIGSSDQPILDQAKGEIANEETSWVAKMQNAFPFPIELCKIITKYIMD
jgi:ankyrin repeat protein